MKPTPLAVLALACLVAAGTTPAHAHDTDGPDCGRPIHDFGDAPEGVALPWGPIAHFPTCIAPGAPGTQEAACPALSTAPGPTGYMQNVQDGTSNYWIGCFQDAAGALYGVDSETDGKFGPAAGQPSVCDPAVITDCNDPFGGSGDECMADGSDAGVRTSLYALLCGIQNTLDISTANCGAARLAYLNVLLDLNSDGDWNDVVPCVENPACPCSQTPACFPEWAVKNLVVQVPSGCGQLRTPAFNVPFTPYPVWTRVSLTDGPVADDFPWAGSANQPGGFYAGGETEDYLFGVSTPDPAQRSTWGSVRIRYR